MDYLPLSNVPMLVSSINFLLRDREFDNLDQICYCFGIEREEMDRILGSGSMPYSLMEKPEDLIKLRCTQLIESFDNQVLIMSHM